MLSIPILIISRKSLGNNKSHGFYRFFEWEAILLLLVIKIEYWFVDPFSLHQVVSWILLLISIAMVIAGVTALNREGKPGNIRNDENLYSFEKTTKLAQTGIFRYIRHPLYSSLLFLNRGIYFKKPDLIFVVAALLASGFLYLTALADEKECTRFFGESYRQYMKKSRRFVPFLF